MSGNLLIKNARALENGTFVTKDIIIQGGKIVSGCKEDYNFDSIIDAQGKTAVSGFIDVHSHGAVGADANTASAEQLIGMSRFFAGQGTTSWLASILTDTKEQTIAAINNIREAMKSKDGARLMGVHLEGPFLCKDYKGAMPEHLLQKGNIELLKEYCDVAGDALKYITMSPEIEGVPEMIEYLKGSNVKVALGHSGATCEQTMDCINKGAVAITHTANGMKLFHQHEPSIFGAAMISDAYCETICDGRHLCPDAFKFILKCKGSDRIMAITDSIMATGMPDGNYKLGVNDIVVKDGDAMLADGSSRAGSTLTMQNALKNIIKFTGLPLEKVIPFMGKNQAEMLGISNTFGKLEDGYMGDVVLLDNKYNVCTTIVEGIVVYNA